MPFLTLSQPPFNTSLMGVLRGVFDYYAFAVSDAMLYGGSGHAFVMNVHEVICPSGPYCWNYAEFFRLVGNLGVRIDNLGSFHAGSSPSERAALETEIRIRIDRSEPCSALNMDNQIIFGYDQIGLQLLQPWGPDCGITPARLSFGTWDEFGDEIHANFFAFSKVKPVGEDVIIANSLRFAVDLHRNPARHTEEPYAVGAHAYDRWIAAVRSGHGQDHGNWWNAMVWSECRRQASDYLREVAAIRAPLAPVLSELAAEYLMISEALKQVGEKERAVEAKIELLQGAQRRETACIDKLEEVAGIM